MTSVAHGFLGTALPVIQAPMAGVQDAALALAVSAAGGLGSLPCAMLSPDGLRKELERLRDGSHGRPFNVNFFCHRPPTPNAEQEALWRAALRPYFDEAGLDPALITPGAGRAPFSAEAADLLAAFRPAVVSFHFGLPSAELLGGVRAWGAKVISSATTLEEGLWLESQGVDAVIAQGLEAGGHRGMFLGDQLSTQVGTMALVPQLVRHLRVPVIAAGGISDARGVRAALALGASAVQVGTAYLLCTEAMTSPVHRAALRSPEAAHTALTNLFTGRPARSIVNRMMREQGPIGAHAPAFPLATAAMAPLRAWAEARGSSDFSPLWAGQNVSGCREIGAGELTRELAAT